jgi:hypothetical protein
LAFEYKVECFVYSSAERGGDVLNEKADAAHMGKVLNEKYVKELGERGLAWTYVILFLSEAQSDTFRKNFTTCLFHGEL